MDEITRHILKKINRPDLLDILVQHLSAADLNSILLDVFNQRIAQQDAAALLSKYAGNRFVQPATVDVIRQKEQELQSYRLLKNAGFEPVELSPVTQLGACSIVAPVNQKKILTALRGTEVQSDPTNALALHYAHLKKTGQAGEGPRRFCSIARVTRAQAFSNPAFTPHFTVCSLVTQGTAGAEKAFEKNALCDHIAAQEKICREVYGITSLRLAVIPQNGYSADHPFVAACVSYLRQTMPSMPVTIREPGDTRHYYHGFQIKMIAEVNGEALEIGDGGPVNWTQQLLQNQKERMFISGLGAQLLFHLSTR